MPLLPDGGVRTNRLSAGNGVKQACQRARPKPRELAERPDGALVTQLPRQPGSRENRWMHLLSGEPAVRSSSAADLAADFPSLGISELAAVKANVARLEAEVHELKDLLAKVCSQLGIK